MLVRPVMKSLFFLAKPRKKRLASLARLMIIYYTTSMEKAGSRVSFSDEPIRLGV